MDAKKMIHITTNSENFG